MTWLAFVFALELGIAPNIGVLQYEPWAMVISEWEIGYTELQTEIVLWNLLFAGGGIRTYITPSGALRWSPNTTVYFFQAGLRYRGLEVGYRTRCFHPTVPYLPLFEQEITGLEGWYEELYVRFEGQIGGR